MAETTIEVTVETAAPAGPRPGGARFGTLVHAVLADVPLAGNSDMVASLARAHGRVLGADAEEVSAAEGLGHQVLANPPLQAAAAADRQGRCYREMPVTWRLESGGIVEGNADLAFAAGDEMVVVDFKTDRELDGTIDRYRRQVQLYAAAIGAALQKPARGVLMQI